MSITINIGTPRIGNFQLTGLERTLKDLDADKSGDISLSEKDHLDINDSMTTLLSSHLPAGFTITPINVAKLEKKLEEASNGVVTSSLEADSSRYRISTTGEKIGVLENGNLVYKIKNSFPDTRTPVAKFNFNGLDFEVACFVLPRESTLYFEKMSEVNEENIKLNIKLLEPGKSFLSFPTTSSTLSIEIEKSTNLKDWSSTGVYMTYNNLTNRFEASINKTADNGVEFYRAKIKQGEVSYSINDDEQLIEVGADLRDIQFGLKKE